MTSAPGTALGRDGLRRRYWLLGGAAAEPRVWVEDMDLGEWSWCVRHLHLRLGLG